MAKFKALITGRYSPEVEAISEDAPSEVEICFLPRGEALGDHVSDVDIIYGHIGAARSRPSHVTALGTGRFRRCRRDDVSRLQR